MTEEVINKWFYIKHKSTNKVVATLNSEVLARSQAVVIKPQYTDNELWCWDAHHLRNKSTGLVLDIRKGRLRLIEDTEICLFHKKPQKEAHNQLWAIRPVTSSTSEHPLHENTQSSKGGFVVYSLSNHDWVLDVPSPVDNLTEDPHKLILFPHQDISQSQIWDLIQQGDMDTEELDFIYEDNSLASSIFDEGITSGQVSPTSTVNCEYMEFAHGLSPSKRNSQSSLNSDSRKGSLEDIYLYQAPQLYPEGY